MNELKSAIENMSYDSAEYIINKLETEKELKKMKQKILDEVNKRNEQVIETIKKMIEIEKQQEK